jgi:hypothetical protein
VVFKTIVLACALAAPTECWEFRDTRGYHSDYESCRSRAYEIADDIVRLQGQYLVPVKFQCLKIQGENL